MKLLYTLGVLVAWLVPLVSASVAEENKRKLEVAKLGSTRNVHSFGKNLLCGQPTAEDFAEAKRRGIKTVITLRQHGEVDWDEAATVKGLGLEFYRFGFRAPDTLKDETFDQARKVLADSRKKPVLLHCGSANRVGAIWAAHRVLDDGLSVEDALKEAKEVGLRSRAYRDKAVDYIQRTKAKSETSGRN